MKAARSLGVGLSVALGVAVYGCSRPPTPAPVEAPPRGEEPVAAAMSPELKAFLAAEDLDDADDAQEN